MTLPESASFLCPEYLHALAAIAGELYAVGVFLEGAQTVNFAGGLAALHVAGELRGMTAGQVQKAFQHGMGLHVHRLAFAKSWHGSGPALLAPQIEPALDRGVTDDNAFVLAQPALEIAQARTFGREGFEFGAIAIDA